MKSLVASIMAIAAIGLVTIIPGSAFALNGYYPNEMSLGVDPDIAFPLGSFSDVANAGIGINGNFQYRLDPNWDLLVNLGYIHWSGKSNIAGFDYSFSAVPFQGGAKYFFRTRSLDSPHFYVGGLIGFHNMSMKRPFLDNDGRFLYSASRSQTEFSLAPLGGLEYAFSPNVNLDVSARYQYVADNFSYFGLRAGLNFRIR